ncbi:hypothetical protein ACFL6R_04040, partial [Gemmatimonadota bacterium]
MRFIIRVSGCVLLFLLATAGASGQFTSSRVVVVLPLFAPPSDSLLPAELLESVLAVIQPAVSRRGVRVTLEGQNLSRRELAGHCSRPIEMEAYAQRAGAAFLVSGGYTRQPTGDYQAALILFGVDDRTVIAAESRSFSSEAGIRAGIRDMARAISRPRVLTPSDTPIIYSMVIPGIGQLMVGKPLHAIVFGGLVVRAITKTPEVPRPEWDAAIPNWREEIKRRQIMNVMVAWLANVADTMIL